MNSGENEVELAIFRIVQEALSNIAMHSEAYHVSMNIMQAKDTLVIKIKDNGMGFDVARQLEASKHGLKSMVTRAKFINGQLTILSEEFQGTQIALHVPLG